MSTPEVRRPIQGYVRNNRRRKVLNVDLNVHPGEALEEINVLGENLQQAQTVVQGRGGSGSGGSALQMPATIDVEAIDDDVVISSPRRFAEARKKSRRNHDATGVVNGVSRAHPGNSEEDITSLSLNSHTMRKRVPPNQTIIDCEQYINLEISNNAKRENVKKSPEPLPSVPPPEEPTFTCPVCMGPLVEEMTTKCGHIFCKECIKTSITKQNKCPTCRRKVTMKDIIRVYLPGTS